MNLIEVNLIEVNLIEAVHSSTNSNLNQCLFYKLGVNVNQLKKYGRLIGVNWGHSKIKFVRLFLLLTSQEKVDSHKIVTITCHYPTRDFLRRHHLY